jgi:carboxyl-terminal processing protease
VSKFADSLKKSYKTMAGRTVLSGGGIDPDIKVTNEEMSMVSATLYAKNHLFDYATVYAGKHATIPDAATFSLSDQEFNDFTRWLDKKDYSYKTETEVRLDSLIAVSTREKYYEGTKQEFESLKSKISHDKKMDLAKHKDNVKQTLENEIVSRYYYMRGRIANSMQHDRELDRAVSVLEKPEEYRTVLKPRK